ILGTPRYMAPEQLAGHPADARADLYSFALVMHEALTGTLPYVTNKHLAELRPDAPLELQKVIEECLRQDPEDRPARAVDVYLRLQEAARALAAEESAGANGAGRNAALPADGANIDLRLQRARRRVLVASTLAIVLLGAGGLAAVGIRNMHPSATGRESVLGLEVGQSRDDVVSRF